MIFGRFLFVALLGLLASASCAQEFPVFEQGEDYPTYSASGILVVNQDALFSGTVLGRDIMLLEQQEQDELVEEGRRIGDAFVREEQELTSLRDTLPSDEFIALADAFDEKVVAARAAQEANDSTLIANIEARRRFFFQAIAPVLASLMQKYRAVAIIDRRSVLLFDRNLDITSEAVELLDKAYSENPDMINLIGPANE